VVLDPPRGRGLGAETAARLANIGGTGDCLSFMAIRPRLPGIWRFLTGFGAEAADGNGAQGHRYEVSEVQLF